MAASAADIRSALSIPEPNATAGPSQPKKPAAPKTRKPDGIPRELYSLIGPSAPSLAAQLAKPRLKQKPNFGTAPRVRWEQRPFKNGARKDGLELKHWVKASTEPEGDYAFAKYNVPPTSYTYSLDEYTRFLEDPEWTKEETDYLFTVAAEYDLRWYVIHDRYEFPGGPERVLDDLKDRFYSVCRKLVRNRPWAGDEASKQALINSFTFDKERELMRKRYIVNLENRTPEQIAEEEALYLEVKRLEHNERKFKRDRDNLLRMLAGMDSGLPDIVEDDPSILTPNGTEPISTVSVTKKKSTKKGGTQAMDVDVPATPVTASAAPPKPTAKMAAQDALNCITRTDVSTSTGTKAAHQLATLRSFKLPVPKAAIAPKVTQALAELGISHSRLVMPTRTTVQQLEGLIEAATALVETKRLVDKVDYDIQVLKTRLGMRAGSQAAGEGGAGGGEEDVEMDGAADGEGETEGEDGRGQSVMSARSGRGRKHARRSVSVSSMDTASTRAGPKRQKRG